jgi:hypothetical protein
MSTPRKYKKESIFELSLRLTEYVKSFESSVIQFHPNDDLYLDSKMLLDLIYEALDEREPVNITNPIGSQYDHYHFNGECYPVDWKSVDGDSYKEHGR